VLAGGGTFAQAEQAVGDLLALVIGLGQMADKGALGEDGTDAQRTGALEVA